MDKKKIRCWSLAVAFLFGVTGPPAVAQEGPGRHGPALYRTAADPPGTEAVGGEKEAGKPKKDINVWKGQVLDDQGKPVRGAKVGVADAKEGWISCFGNEIYCNAADNRFLRIFTKQSGKRFATVTTNKNGEFTIKGLKHGAYNVVAYHRKKGAAVLADVSFRKGAEPLKITLDPPAYIEGTIKGLPEGGRYRYGTMCELSATGLPKNVWFGESVFVSSKSGYAFRTEPLPKAEKWTLTASQYVKKQGYSASLLAVPIAVEPGKTAEINVDITTGAKLSGEVRGPTGKPLSGVSVVAKAPGDMGWAYGAVTNKKGKYTIRGLPDGKYTLEAKRWAIRTGLG